MVDQRLVCLDIMDQNILVTLCPFLQVIKSLVSQSPPIVSFFLRQSNTSGYLFRISRDDGLPFEGRRVLKWKKELGR